ncbi:MAG: ABC transporter ATP-binding protein [Candidatus Kerfeldbacteria bacterium CG_4_10_14_0_8_um_filter_42_10]|uniref:ABC transporter ATP-binding protein n=1 Tax=Candidatus Kerfeldbacteria bacterium CG_4_10_14_0_8_um_filter_42_10 TaxID=2014248 RepID=A0A2M7RJL0_9BACT|nr:MAG: ABC transporter ATP-binding protein [Candidatus Kerfeldbacteria bacterium CG_4_10_14_0_8_um_filter_42_10]
MPEKVIDVENFSKSFGENEVVSNLSFEVNKGEVFALLGANGSGKTTTIRCLLNILAPTKGSLLVNGERYNQAMSQEVGYLPEERGLYTSERVIDTMVYFGELKGMDSSQARKWSLDYLTKVGISEKAKEKVKKLSSGQQQKVQLGITIINNPNLLILDEPTKGLDPVNRTLLMDLLMEMKNQGSTIVFITHQMEEVEKLADRLLMIKDGKEILYGGVDEVKERFGTNRIHVAFTGDLPKNERLYHSKEIENNYAELLPQENVQSQEILQYLLSQNLKIIKYELTLPSLNEIFIQVSG